LQKDFLRELTLIKLFSPVVHYKIAYLFLAVAALEDWDIHSVNVKTAYLYDDLDKEIYME